MEFKQIGRVSFLLRPQLFSVLSLGSRFCLLSYFWVLAIIPLQFLNYLSYLNLSLTAFIIGELDLLLFVKHMVRDFIGPFIYGCLCKLYCVVELVFKCEEEFDILVNVSDSQGQGYYQ